MSGLNNLPSISYIDRLILKCELEDDFIEYVKWVFEKVYRRKFFFNWHHYEIINTLIKVYNGDIIHLIINIPPRYSKTEIVIKCFISWCLAKKASSKFMHLSYSDDLALDNSSAVKEIITSDEFQELWPIKLKADSKSKKKWYTDEGGGVYATSAGGQITGFGAGSVDDDFGGAILIDDPIKPDDADSDTVRKKINERFNSTVRSRTNNTEKTPIIVIMQRLHEDDFSGFLLDGGSDIEDWHRLKLPAINTEGPSEHDPRFKGEVLWERKHKIKRLEVMEKKSPYTFSGQYQQEPSPPEGIMFKRMWWKIVEAVPAGARLVRGWDLAATKKTTSAFTAGVKMSEKDGKFYVEDSKQEKGTPGEIENFVLSTAKLDGIGCKVSLPLDPGAAGKTVQSNYNKLLMGFYFEVTAETGSKEDRAKPFSSQCQAGNVYLVKGDWNKSYIEEHAKFPNGKFKDQVDASSRAFGCLTAENVGEFSDKFTEDYNDPTITKEYLNKDEW